MRRNVTGGVNDAGERTCETNEDCPDPDAICHPYSNVNRKFCVCHYNLQKTDRDGHCTDLMEYKECSSQSDCSGHDSKCQYDGELKKKVCYCAQTLSRANNAKGDCTTVDWEEDITDGVKSDVFNVTNLIEPLGVGETKTNETANFANGKDTSNRTLTVLQESSYGVPTSLEILIPAISASLFLIIVFILISWRIHVYKKKRRKDPVPKNTENVQLLDTMNIVNKNPQYMMSFREGGVKGKNFTVSEIPTDRVTIQDVVGEGAFGQVYRGIYSGEDGTDIGKIAVKVLKDGVSNEVKEDFEREVEIMSAFDHDNILKLLGVVTKGVGETPYMIFEYMVHGDLAELLRRNDPAMRKNGEDFVLQKTDLIDIAIQIANGMTYLTSQHFVHRDLATRNCLVGEGLVVKISDFGMARDVYTCDYYRIGGSRMLPVRWMSPESVKYGRFTTESDIWAYGVVLWEIFSFGRQPYYGHSNEEVVRFLDEGILLQRPDECPSTVYHVMLGCWKRDPKERLLFTKIHKHLVDYSKTILRNAHMQSFNMENETEVEM